MVCETYIVFTGILLAAVLFIGRDVLRPVAVVERNGRAVGVEQLLELRPCELFAPHQQLAYVDKLFDIGLQYLLGLL
jgi:hypothetical protein